MLRLDGFEVLTFDCYGTLIDWEAGLLGALRPVFSAHGARFEDERVLEAYGELEHDVETGEFREYRDVLATVLDGLGARFGFAPTAAERRRFAGSVADWPAFPDSAAALRALGTRYRLGIISNVDGDLFAHSARKLGVDFEWVVTAQQARSYKPSPGNFRMALDRIGVPRERVLHVAQSLFHDIVPARELGLANVWVNRRHAKPGPGATRPASVRPDLEVPDLASLARLAGVA